MTWQTKAAELATPKNKSWRQIARELGKAKSTVSDALRKWRREQDWLKQSTAPVRMLGDGTYQNVETGEIYAWNSAGKLVSIRETVRVGDIEKTTERRYSFGSPEWKQMMAENFPKKIPAELIVGYGFDASKVDVRSLCIKDAEGKILQSAGHDNSRILFISDMHIPFHHSGLLPFLEGLKTRYNPTRIICLGDELDKHALSFHDSDPDLDSAGAELKKSLPVIAELKKMFPVMDIIESNHGSLLYRKAKHHGLPRAYLKSYNEVLGVDNGWQWHPDLTLTLPDGQEVYVHHGKTAQAIKVAQLQGMSHVCGHYHESFGIQYYSTPSKLIWGMNTGCLIDKKSLAFHYNNVNMKRPVIGTGLIIDGVPILEAMPL